MRLTLDDLTPVPGIVKQDRSQPVKPSDFCEYMSKRLTPTRIARAQRMLEEEAELLAEINAEYGIPARYLVSLWGLETNFGDYMGDYKVVDTVISFKPISNELMGGSWLWWIGNFIRPAARPWPTPCFSNCSTDILCKKLAG